MTDEIDSGWQAAEGTCAPDAAALLRSARHSADLSQRELAAAAQVDRSVVAKIEAGVRSPGFATMARLLAAAGCRLVALGPDAAPLARRSYDDALDAGYRRWPAHLDVRPVTTERDWWYGMFLTDMRPLPPFTADWVRLRGRTRARRTEGSKPSRPPQPPLSPPATSS